MESVEDLMVEILSDALGNGGKRAGRKRPARTKTTYPASRIKRKRRTRTDMEALRAALYEIVKSNKPVTVRQAFYLAVSRQVIEKTEGEYDAIQRLLVQMRRQKALPFDWIADNTRWMRKPRTYDSLEDALRSTAAFYRLLGSKIFTCRFLGY